MCLFHVLLFVELFCLKVPHSNSTSTKVQDMYSFICIMTLFRFQQMYIMHHHCYGMEYMWQYQVFNHTVYNQINKSAAYYIHT